VWKRKGKGELSVKGVCPGYDDLTIGQTEEGEISQLADERRKREKGGKWNFESPPGTRSFP